MDYDSFDEFEAVLFKLSESTKYPTKKDAPLLSPAIYQTGTTRANDNVVGWAGFGILDIDDYDGVVTARREEYDADAIFGQPGARIFYLVIETRGGQEGLPTLDEPASPG